MYDNILNVGMKSDLLRYLVLDVEGGVYTDLDTTPLKPISDWIPPNARGDVRLVVGIEYDRRDDVEIWPGILRDVSFCQWTIAAAPGHPVFREMVAHILRSTARLADNHQRPLSEIYPTDVEVLETTGPAAWTDVIFKRLKEHQPSLNSTRDLSFMVEPTLFGDVLVLPVDGFGMGQPHSHSTRDGAIPPNALVRHLFLGSWRER